MNDRPLCGAKIRESAKCSAECGSPLVSADEENPETGSGYRLPSAPPWDPEKPGPRHRRGLVLGLLAAALVLAAAAVLFITGTVRFGGKETLFSVTPSLTAKQVIRPGMRWHGFLRETELRGKKKLGTTETEIWAVLDQTDDGSLYFELYDTEDHAEDTAPLLSLWVRVEGDRILPLIGDHDAWFRDWWLMPEDADLLTFSLESGALVNECEFKDGGRTFRLSFRLTQTD